MTTTGLRAAEVVRERLRAAAAPTAAIVLGSGLGGLAEKMVDVVAVDYADVPGFATPTVAGHSGRVLSGRLAGRQVLAFAGRFHMYEGHAPEAAGLIVRVAHALGANVLLLSNAAGAIRHNLRPGDLMVISDHINLSWRNPLVGPLVAGDERFPDMSQPYDQGLLRLLHAAAARLGIALQEGVYGGLLGPTYETPAEVRMLDRLGVDAVGMSTVPEVIVARAMGMRCCAISCITNQAAGISPQRIAHEDVLAVTAVAASAFERLVTEFVGALDA
ncbi:MAG TPA: purine-nucleoside phosphorylase [Gemmatimonadaceae bacterium]|nr:purine-nucleoside phosphorylase [Gemmatimonadaceae bacterium]